MTTQEIMAAAANLSEAERKELAKSLSRKAPEGYRRTLNLEQRVVVLPWSEELERSFPHTAQGFVASAGAKRLVIVSDADKAKPKPKA